MNIYHFLTSQSAPLLNAVLHRRLEIGKEHPQRIDERRGLSQLDRPKGQLFWIHAASVGEAQSALILINSLLEHYPDLHILITSGTTSSAKMLERNLHKRALHQFYPLDHPQWVCRFLDHWAPDCILWMESEIWPNMLKAIGQRQIPAILINARISDRSFMRWRFFKKTITQLLNSFEHILCQTPSDALHFKALGAERITVTDNIKYSAKPLAANDYDLKHLSAALQNRPCWVYASSHKGEEILAAQAHQILKAKHPDILTIIVPRHPERRDEIRHALSIFNLNLVFRGSDKTLPSEQTDLYIIDTLGELGLFYRICPLAVIGRCFSDDGGGGHNPIEAAQLHCAVLYGPHIQNFQDIYDDMNNAKAALRIDTKETLATKVSELLCNPEVLKQLQDQGFDFVTVRRNVVEKILEKILETIKIHKILDPKP